jgi:ribosomal protein L29
MAILRIKDIAKMNEKERTGKVKDLKMELVKNRIDAGKGGKMKAKEIRKTIARLLTFNRQNKKFVETK